VAYSATGMVADQPLTLSVALLSRGAPDPSPPPPRQRTAISPDQSAFHRRRALSARFRMAVRSAAPTFAIFYDPRARPGSLEPHWAPPEVALVSRLPGQPNPFRGPTSRASLVQGPDSAFAGGRSRGDCSPRGLLPRPRGSSTFCRELVTETAGGAALSGARIAHPLRAHPASLLARGAPPAISLAQDLPVGPLPAFPREEERDRQSPRCLPSWAALQEM